METRHLYWILTGPSFAVRMILVSSGNETSTEYELYYPSQRFFAVPYRAVLFLIYLFGLKSRAEMAIWLCIGGPFPSVYILYQ
jgi:hypothetical protein